MNFDSYILKEYNVKASEAINNTQSNGWLLKWRKLDENGKPFWLKSCGYLYNWFGEAYSEFVATVVGKDINIRNQLKYDLCVLVIDGVRTIGCRSNEFTKENETFITYLRLMKEGLLRPSHTYSSMSGYERLIDDIQSTTGINIRNYLEDNIVLDSIILNTDRNFWNLGLILGDDISNNKSAQIFDCGSSLGLDKFTRDRYIPDLIYTNIGSAKPFDFYFENQLKLVRRLSRYNNSIENSLDALIYLSNNFTNSHNTYNIVNTIPIETLEFTDNLLRDRIKLLR